MAADFKSCCGGEAAMDDTGISHEKVRKAKNSFTAILDDLNDLERNVFYKWIEEQRRPERNNKTKSDRPCCSEERLKQQKCCNKTICKSERLADIALDLRKLVPLEGTLKTEKILKHDLPPGCHYDDDDDDVCLCKPFLVWFIQPFRGCLTKFWIGMCRPTSRMLSHINTKFPKMLTPVVIPNIFIFTP